MLPTVKKEFHKRMRIAIIAGALFVCLFIPFTANANRLNHGDSPPPGNIYIPANPNIPANHVVSNRTWRSAMLGERPLTRRHEGIDIRGIIPVINHPFIAASSLTDYIDNDVVPSLIAEARRLRARSVSFRYEYHPASDMVSIVIYADVVTTLPHTLVRSVNFCATNGRLLSMNEATNMEISPLAERILSERIRNNPERYYAALSTPLLNQAYYLTDYSLVILFDGFRLSTRVGDVDSIELNLYNIYTVVLTEENYRTDGPYGLKMIPLRAMLQGQLGFDVDWCGIEQRATISRNGAPIIELRAYDNEYILLGSLRLSLEAAPQMFNDRMYIPITFFDQVLPLTTFSFDSDGSITFLSYIEN
jgi:hypothetical protein